MSVLRTIVTRGSSRALRGTLLHNTARLSSAGCQACQAPTLQQVSPIASTSSLIYGGSGVHTTQVRFASKKKSTKSSGKNKKNDSPADEIEVEDFPVPVVAKGKKAKAAQVTEADAIEAFHLDKLEEAMDGAVDRLKREMKGVIGRVERLSPSLLDGVRVEEHGQRSPLSSYATVSVHGAEALQVNIFDIASVKAVEKAIRESVDLNLNPQRADEMTLRVPVPRPDMATRESLVKKASELAEQARVVIRHTRQQGQKDLKADQDNKVVGESDARKDAKHLTDATKKRTDEVDQVFNRAKKVLLDE